jgi:hypothetical protein
MSLVKGNNARQQWVKSDGRMPRRRRAPARRQTIGQNIDTRIDNYSRAGYQALRDLNTMRKFINTEMHYVDASGATVASTTTPVFTLLNGMQLGDTSTTRTGQSIKMDKAYFRFYINGNATSIQNIVRVLVVFDKQPNGAIFAIGNLLAQTTPISPLAMGGQNRFVILFDETFALSTNGAGVVYSTSTLNSNQHVMYGQGNVGDVTDINTGSMYMIHFSDQVANPPTISWYNRIWFVDN